MSELALKLIEENKLSKSHMLDLGYCGLIKLPDELFDCIWLEELILRDKYWKNGEQIKSSNSGNENDLENIPSEISNLRNLKIFRAGGEYTKEWYIKDYSFLKNFGKLELLDLRGNNIADISFLSSLSSLQFLDLSYNKISDISFLQSLRGLQTLDLCSNKISDVSFLQSLKGLQTLDLSENRISDISHLQYLIALQYLDLYQTSIFGDIGFLQSLKGLQSLNLRSNPYIFDYGFLRSLKDLKSLNLRSNKISDISYLQSLTRLQFLDIGFNKISDISYLQSLTGLQSLDLGYNNISDISDLEKLTGLKSLDLRANQISNINSLQSLTNLRFLNLSYNKISDITFLGKLGNLAVLDLMNNKIADVKQFYPIVNIKGHVSLSNNPVLSELPEDVVNVGWNAIRDRMMELQQQDNFYTIKEIKLLMLGNTNVGKSSLVEYLETRNEPFLTESTHGVSFKVLKNVIDGVNINCWDFGGQDFFHATHRLFFSPGALHIVLWNVKNIRREVNEVSFDLDYWLRTIERLLTNYYGSDSEKKSEVIICENKIDLQAYKETKLNETDLEEKFKELNLTFSSINLKPIKKSRTEFLKDLIAEKAEGLFNSYSINYHKYLSVIRNHIEPFVDVMKISLMTYGEVDSIETAVRVFHNMGLLLYFPEIIPGKIFSKPQVLLDLLYNKVLQDKSKYYLTKEEIIETLTNNELELSEKEVIDLLQHFDLIFQIPSSGDNIFFIPQYLPPLSGHFKDYIEDIFDKATIIIKSDHYLMSTAMQKIYSRYGSQVDSDAHNNFRFWKDGIIIKKGGQKLVISFDRQAQTILLFADKEQKNFELQHEVVDFIIEIPEKSKKIRALGEDIVAGGRFTYYKREVNWQSNFFDVYVAGTSGFFIDWQQLVKVAEVGVDKVIAYKNIKDYEALEKGTATAISNFNRFLPQKIKDVSVKSEVKDKTSKQEIFFSYAWGEGLDEIVDELYESLSNENVYKLLRDKKDIHYCDLISDFMKRIGEGSYIIVVVSDKYLRSEYCMVELYEILRNSKLELNELKKKIFPIYIESIRLNKPLVQKEYVEHWQKEEDNWSSLKMTSRNFSDKQNQKLLKIKRINSELGDLLVLLSDMNVLSKDVLSSNNFSLIKDAIEKRMQENNSIATDSH